MARTRVRWEATATVEGGSSGPYPTHSSRENRVSLVAAATASLAPSRSCLYNRTARRTSATIGASTCVKTLVGTVASHDVHGFGDVASTRSVRRGVQEVSKGQPAGRLYRARRRCRRCTLDYIRETWRCAVGFPCVAVHQDVGSDAEVPSSGNSSSAFSWSKSKK